MGIDLHPVTACPDPGLDRFERQPTDSQDSSSRLRYSAFSALRWALAWALAAFIRSR